MKPKTTKTKPPFLESLTKEEQTALVDEMLDGMLRFCRKRQRRLVAQRQAAANN